MNTRILSALILCTALFAACDDKEGFEPSRTKLIPSEITITNKLQASVTADAEYSYDKRGNLVNMKYKLWNDERMQTYKFGFDNRNGVFRYVATPSWYLTTQLAIAPNVLGYSIYYHSFHNNCNKEGSSTSGYEYEIEYNEYDYPVRITRESVGFIPGNKIVYTITYRKAGAEI